MTDNLSPAGVQDISDALRDRLRRYIEAAYYIRNQDVVAERRALLSEPGAITREPFIETTPSYEIGQTYDMLGLPKPIGEHLQELSKLSPGIGIFPKPYRHQAEALRAFFNERRDLIVSTGTGSGKTETFLLPIIGSLVEEAASRPASFHKHGFRAMLLYPMNALVSDQIARLRRMLGDDRLKRLFRERYCRHPMFGMYTSRTPYPGPRNAEKDSRYLLPLLKYYRELEDGAERDGSDSTSVRLVSELKARGRWPAKDLRSFFGQEGGHWDKRLITQPSDSELLTRHEIHAHVPDILVTNYSMLEYMLMRPIERSIFNQTRQWLAGDSRNQIILVIDEAHLYRGTAGAEVAYLIRRLQARLGIGRGQMRCILTSASMGPDATVEHDAVAFANALTGVPAEGAEFRLVRGYPEPRSPGRPGTAEEAASLAGFDQSSFTRRAESPDRAVEAIAQLGTRMGWDSPPKTPEELQSYLYRHLSSFGPIGQTISSTTGQATSLDKLSTDLFPTVERQTARRASEVLLALGTFAHNGQRPLLQTRIHMMFRGLPSLWACINPRCTSLRAQPQGEALLGRLYTEPRTQCECGARVYEVLVHRDCGAIFLRAFGAGPRPDFYWHEAGGKVDPKAKPLTESWLVIEQPHHKKEKDGSVEPIWIDMTTGRIEIDRPQQADRYRRLWRSIGNAIKDDDEDKESIGEQKFPFSHCPVCVKKSPHKVLDLATRGERPFANIVHEQFISQPPSRPTSDDFPNGGRKVLLFADGRQKAARLARDLPREVEFDTFRQALALAICKLGEEDIKSDMGINLYKAFVAICAKNHLHFFDQEFGSQKELLKHIQEFRNSFSFAEFSEDFSVTEAPMSYRRHLLDQVANPFYSVYSLGSMVVEPSAGSLRKIRRKLAPASVPAKILEQIEAVTTFWIQELLTRGAFDKSIPPHVRERVSGYYNLPTRDKRLQDLEKVIAASTGASKEQMKLLREALYAELTEVGDGQYAYLNPNALSISLAFDRTWLRCAACGNVQHTDLFGSCAVCGDKSLVACPPEDQATSARYDYYRSPLRAALQGGQLAHITAEEHTAQLSQKDAGAVYATTEEFELRFQDIALGSEHPPIDVLSCTTTMEVGIDIGSLVAIGMRNVPPQRENYQQRAGRAGRRGSAISTVITYADSGPHDHFYYQNPQEMIAGDTRRPLLSIERMTIARRHISAYLLQSFFHERVSMPSNEGKQRLEQDRGVLSTALGTREEFFKSNGPLSFQAFQRWVEERASTRKGEIALAAAQWLPDEPFKNDASAKIRFVTTVASEFVETLEELSQQPNHKATNGTGSTGPQGLLDALFDSGLLPSYAFPTDLASFYVFDEKGDIKERPQQSKIQALSEYAPGRLLVINKQTYRVGGIYTGVSTNNQAASLFHEKLATYVYCPECTYTRLDEPLRGQEPCPVCNTALCQSEMLDPPGFSPEKGQPIGERDREQEISYAAGAQLPLPTSADNMQWVKAKWPNLSYTYEENREFVVVNRGPQDKGFLICEQCGAAWPYDDAPRKGAHSRPYTANNLYGKCIGQLHQSHIYLGTKFRSDLLLIRGTLQAPFGYHPGDPWLRDALRTTSEALALAASRVLDADPSELSSGHRLLPAGQGARSFDLYLYDTASGGAGYAAEAGEELAKILDAALKLVESCPQECERSCTRCLRHYGNRFWHSSLDRHLAAQVLRHLITGAVPQPAPTDVQRKQLAPLRRFLELENWDVVDSDSSPLAIRSRGKIINIGTYPALLDRHAPEFMHPHSATEVLLPDYVLARDLPAAYEKLRQQA